MMEEKCPADEERSDSAMQQQGAGKVHAEPLAVGGFVTTVLELSGYGTLLLLKRLGDDADVGDAGLLDRIHHRRESAEGNALVGPQVDDALGVGLQAALQKRRKLVHVDRLVLQKDVL